MRTWGGSDSWLSPHGSRPQDTLRDCTQEEHSCLSSLQFVSPLYFVSFVLTAQFVLINVVVAVLMKHLDDSNKEAQEDAEMDAEIELEMAHGLGPSPRPPPSSPGAPGRGPGGAGCGGDAEGRLCRRCYSPAQVGGRLPGRQGPQEAGTVGWGTVGLGRPPTETSVFWGPTMLSSKRGDPVTRGQGPGHGRRDREGSSAPPTRSPGTRSIIPPVPTPSPSA